MSDEIKKRGRPKGSKNTVSVAQIVKATNKQDANLVKEEVLALSLKPAVKDIDLESMSLRDLNTLFDKLCELLNKNPANVINTDNNFSSTPIKKRSDKEVAFRKNKFKDTLEDCQDDRAFTKQVKFSITKRRKNNEVYGNCEKCNKRFQVFFNETKCNDCCTKAV